MSIKIGITGGIGSGKTIVSHLLEVMEIPVYDSDMEAKKLTRTDAVIREKLIGLLGEEVYVGNTLNKPLLASYIFGHPAQAAQVNAIIHPRVKEHFRRWVSLHETYKVVGIESAILLEAGFSTEVDRVLLVAAPLELRLQRAMSRDFSSKEQIMARINSQMDEEQRIKQADYVIYNDENHPLISQLLSVLEDLRE